MKNNLCNYECQFFIVERKYRCVSHFTGHGQESGIDKIETG